MSTQGAERAVALKGDVVRIWFDTGALGHTILYGRVIAAGPKAYRVRWESGLTNRITRNGMTAEPEIVQDVETLLDAERVLRKVGG